MKVQSRQLHIDGSSGGDDRLFAKIRGRMLPILWIVYFFNYLDRTNIAYVHLQIKNDLGFSDATFGLGASLTFIGMIAFEIPASLILMRIGMRKTLVRIAVCWGLCSAAMCLVKTPTEFYILRFMIGMFEAGLIPGVLYLLTVWFPLGRRGQPTSIFYTATTFAGVVSGPIAGVLMTYLNGFGSLHGWQWLFIIEGLPCVVLAFFAYRLLADSPGTAQWLNSRERDRVQHLIQQEQTRHHSFDRHELAAVLRDPRLWGIGVSGFLMLIALFALTFWQPTLLRGFGLSILEVGLYSAIPAFCAVCASIVIARHSDASGERCLHYCICLLFAAGAFFIATVFAKNVVVTMVCLCVAWMGLNSAFAILLTLPGRIFSGKLAAPGLAIVAVMHGSAGIVGPYGLALLKTASGGFTSSLYAGCALLIASVVLFYPFFSGRSWEGEKVRSDLSSRVQGAERTAE